MTYSVSMCLLLGIWLATSALITPITAVQSETNWKQSFLYFEKVNLHCQTNTLNKTVQSVNFWILPSGDIRRPADFNPDHHISLVNDGFMLSIDRLDDTDFGIYYCIVKTGENSTDAIKFGINVDGAYYGSELMNRYKRSAIVGGIAAGVMLILVSIAWVLCANFTCCKPSQDVEATTNAKDVPNGVTGKEPQVEIENDKIDGWIQSTKIGDSIYDSADAIKLAKRDASPVNTLVVNSSHEDRLLSSDSGHYQTINSLERDRKLLSESDISEDIKPLKTVFRRDWSETAEENKDTDGCSNASENQTDIGTELSDTPEQTVDNNVDKSDSSSSKDGDTIASDPFDEVEYSLPSRTRATDKETVVVIEGDVIIEPNGISVAVTTVATKNQTESYPKDVIIAAPDTAVTQESVAKKIEIAPLVSSISHHEMKLNERLEAADISNNSNNEMDGDKVQYINGIVSEENATDKPVKIEIKTDGERKISTISSNTSKSEIDSNQSVSVDEETFSKFQNVLATLLTKQSNVATMATKSGMGSRSTSADSNVFNEDAQSNVSAVETIEDIRL